MNCFYLIIGLLAFIQDGKCSDTSEYSSEHGSKDFPGAKSTTCDCGWTNKQVRRIVGGVETDINEYPMMVGFYYKPQQLLFCGGTIITAYHVLTAAHCTELFDQIKLANVQLRVGEHDLKKSDESSATVFLDILNYKQHPEYDDEYLFHDISIVNLKKKIQFSTQVGPACMPRGDIDLVGEKLKVLGWGRLQEEGELSNTLMEVNLEVISYDTCIKDYRWFQSVKGSFFCTLGQNKDSCQSDSGGPLFYHDKETNRYAIVGVTSNGIGCAMEGIPAVNTYVSNYLAWIKEVIAETRPDAVMCYKKE